jgi:hypothetical protein
VLVRNVKYHLQNEVGYISEIMCGSVDKSFNYVVLLLTCDLLRKHVVYFLGCSVVVMPLWLCFVLARTESFCIINREGRMGGDAGGIICYGCEQIIIG